jgi:hypothetical protein
MISERRTDCASELLGARSQEKNLRLAVDGRGESDRPIPPSSVDQANVPPPRRRPPPNDLFGQAHNTAVPFPIIERFLLGSVESFAARKHLIDVDQTALPEIHSFIDRNLKTA